MNVLIVDNDAATLKLLEEQLRHQQHRVYRASSGSGAWRHLTAVPINMVFCGPLTPPHTGLSLCQRIRKARFQHPIHFILLEDPDTPQEPESGFTSEIDDVLSKPIKVAELQARLAVSQRALHRQTLIQQQRLKIKKLHSESIHMLVRLLEMYNPELLNHSQRVSHLSLELAQHHPDVEPQEYKMIECAGLLHDLGMVLCPHDLFNKRRTEMTGEERQRYLKHAEQGEAIIEEIEALRPVARIVRSHHEQHNGRGFPDGLETGQIPLAAKIVAAASIYDNLVHKGLFALEDVPGQLHRLSGYQLDPEIVKLLLDVNRHKIEADAKTIFHEMRLEQIAEGMVLAKNVRLRSGALAMPLHTRITAGTLEKLEQYRNKDHIADKFYVYKS